MFDRVSHHIRGGAQVELPFQIVPMHLDGFGADSQTLCDFLAGRTLADKPQNFSLAPGQQVEGRARWIRRLQPAQ